MRKVNQKIIYYLLLQTIPKSIMDQDILIAQLQAQRFDLEREREEEEEIKRKMEDLKKRIGDL